MAKKKHAVLLTKRLVITIIIVILFIAIFSAWKNSTSQSQQSSTEYGSKEVIISKEDAVAKVKALPEVIDYLKRVPSGLVLVNGEEDNTYMVQVYEIVNGHTATFNWYSVNKTTGELKKEF